MDGLGQADLFENGEPTGFDFNYTCSQPITPLPEYVTFMARWKKPGRILQIVMPVMGGKPGDMNSCDLNVSLKQGVAYFRRNGAVAEEPSAQFKEWMVRHQYDPAHGKEMPVADPGGRPAAAESTRAPRRSSVSSPASLPGFSQARGKSACIAIRLTVPGGHRQRRFAT